MMNKPNELNSQYMIGFFGFSSFFISKGNNSKEPAFAKSAFNDGKIQWSELGFKSLGTLIGPITSPLGTFLYCMIGSKLTINRRILSFIVTVLMFALIPIHYLVNVADLAGSLLMTLKDAFQEKFCSSSLGSHLPMRH